MANQQDISRGLAVQATFTAANNGLKAFKEAAAKFDAAELKQFRDGQGRSLLHHASHHGHADLCKHLLSKIGVDVNLLDHNGDTALALAAARSHKDVVKYLLSEGADVNVYKADSPSPLHRAAGASSEDAVDVIDQLIAAGADVNGRQKDSDGQTSSSRHATGSPLCWAAGIGQAKNVACLLKHGADPNCGASKDEVSALVLAAACASANAVQALLQHGADPKQACRGGSTALHAAVAVKRDPSAMQATVDALLKAGADPDVQDDQGATPLLLAAATGNSHMVQRLLPITAPFEGVPWTPEGVEAYAAKKLQSVEAQNSSAAEGSTSGRRLQLPEVVEVPQPSEPDEQKAAACKRAGDEAFVKQDYQAAADHYSQALRHATRNHIIWANRSAAYLKLGKVEDALHDARLSRCLESTYIKAWFREGSAFAALEQWEDAAMAFLQACSLDPKNADAAKAFQNAIDEGKKEYAKQQAAAKGVSS